MIYSIILGFLFAATILLSGFLRLLLSFVSNSLASKVSFLYLLLGFDFGMGDIDVHFEFSFWPYYITGLLTAIIIVKITGSFYTGVTGPTLNMSASSFVVASIFGLVVRFVLQLF